MAVSSRFRIAPTPAAILIACNGDAGSSCATSGGGPVPLRVVLSLALLFATFTNSSLTAAIEALVVVIVMNILGAFSYFNFLKPYLFTSHLDAWQGLLSKPVDWHPITTGLTTFVIYIAVLMAAAWYQFRRKDILV